MEELLTMLYSLKYATTALCGESNVSCSMIYDLVATLLSRNLKGIPEEYSKATNTKKKKLCQPHWKSDLHLQMLAAHVGLHILPHFWILGTKT